MNIPLSMRRSAVPQTQRLTRISGLLLCLSCATAPAVNNGHQRFEHAEDWAAAFEDPNRDDWQKPDSVIRSLSLSPNASVADVGAATGYFSVRLAQALPQGRVYGVDVESSMVKYLSERAAKAGLANVEAVLAEADDAKIPRPVDLILIVNTYHHLQSRVAYFSKLKSSLKPGGRIAIVDFKVGSKRGPPDTVKVPLAQVVDELRQAGLTRTVEHDFLPEQFFVEFVRGGS
jgi:cyclopropane fatty-acyl-phospholipid synthase-like methyltransferase